MAGTFTIDVAQTFAVAMFMASTPKLKFGTKTGEQEVSNSTGMPKWTVQAAVTFHATNGMAPVSEVITMTIESPGDPCEGLPPGTPVAFDGFRVGLNPPEKKENGQIKGGKLWYQAARIYPAQQRKRAEAA